MEMAPVPDLGVIMQYGSGFTDESQPSDGALWLSKHIDPRRRNSMSLRSVIVSQSNLIQGSESGMLMEILAFWQQLNLDPRCTLSPPELFHIIHSLYVVGLSH